MRLLSSLPKMISRKTLVVKKFMDFHTVKWGLFSFETLYQLTKSFSFIFMATPLFQNAILISKPPFIKKVDLNSGWQASKNPFESSQKIVFKANTGCFIWKGISTRGLRTEKRFYVKSTFWQTKEINGFSVTRDRILFFPAR